MLKKLTAMLLVLMLLMTAACAEGQTALDLLHATGTEDQTFRWIGTDWAVTGGKCVNLRTGEIRDLAGDLYRVGDDTWVYVHESGFVNLDNGSTVPCGDAPTMVDEGIFVCTADLTTVNLITGEKTPYAGDEDPFDMIYSLMEPPVDVVGDYMLAMGICYNWRTQSRLHEEAYFWPAGHSSFAIDGYVFANIMEDEAEDGIRKAVVINTEDGSIVRSFEGEWGPRSYPYGYMAIYTNGQAAIVEQDKDITSIVNWRTGEVLYRCNDCCAESALYNAYIWSLEGAQSIHTMDMTPVPVFNLMQQIAAWDNVRHMAATFDGCFVGEDEDGLTHVYDTEGNLLFTTDCPTVDRDGLNGDYDLLEPLCLTAVSQGVDRLYGVWSPELGQIMPSECEHVQIMDCGFAAWKDGACSLYDMQGHMIW